LYKTRCTVHAFAGLGLAKGSNEVLAARVINSKWNSSRWLQARVWCPYDAP